MKITILTLFPEMFVPLKESIIGRAADSGKLQIDIVNIRDYSQDRHSKCDDYPFGGGAGMVMMPQPIASAIEAADPRHTAHRIYMSPKGQKFTQQKVFELVEKPEILLLCGHYEGVDQRVIDGRKFCRRHARIPPVYPSRRIPRRKRAAGAAFGQPSKGCRVAQGGEP